MINKNNIIFSVVAFIIIIILFIISPMLTKNSKYDINDNQTLFARASNESSNIKDDEKKEFSYIDVDTYLILAHNEDKSLVLVGRSGCQYCNIAEPIIQNIMFKYDLKIYYISTDDFTEDSYRKFSESNDLLVSFATPLLMIVANDNIIDYEQGLLDTSGYINFLVKNELLRLKEK